MKGKSTGKRALFREDMKQRLKDPEFRRAYDEVDAEVRLAIAVAEARDGICTICHVRLRPQVFNTVRRNEEIVQCDTCNRILYFTPVASASAESAAQPAS